MKALRLRTIQPFAFCIMLVGNHSLSVVAAVSRKTTASYKSFSGVHPVLEFGFHSLSVVAAFGIVAGSFIDYTEP